MCFARCSRTRSRGLINGYQVDADGTRRVKVHMIGAASAQAGVAIGDVLIRIVRTLVCGVQLARPMQSLAF